MLKRAPLALLLSIGVFTLLAVVAGTAIAEWRGIPPAATGTPSPTTSVLTDRFGFVWVEGSSRPRVRPEAGPGGFELSAGPYRFSPCSCAVSPDGSRVAYWTGSMPGRPELRVVAVARPAMSATIYSGAEGERVSAAAWSSDGSGIVFSLEGVNPPGGPDVGPPSSALLVIEASGGTARNLIEMTRDAPLLVPLGWDRVAGVAAAGETGPGGYMRGYLTVRTSGDPTPRRIAIAEELLMASVDVSTDQRFVLGVFTDQAGSTLRWWNLTDFGGLVSGPRIGSEVRPMWRPLTAEIAWIHGDVMQILDIHRGVPIAAATFPPGDWAISLFRRDGSAVLAGMGDGRTTYVLLDLESGRTANVPASGDAADSVRFR